MCGGCEDCAAVDPAKPHIAWEYHATVANEKWDDFQLFCDANGIKAIRVEDLFKDGSTRLLSRRKTERQLVTSSPNSIMGGMVSVMPILIGSGTESNGSLR